MIGIGIAIDRQHIISLFSSIHLSNIIKTGTGRPKTAREIHDDNHGYTIDVSEESAFLDVVFKIDNDNDTFLMTFEKFDETMPQEWHNQIVHRRFQLKHK